MSMLLSRNTEKSFFKTEIKDTTSNWLNKHWVLEAKGDSLAQWLWPVVGACLPGRQVAYTLWSDTNDTRLLGWLPGAAKCLWGT